MPQDAVAISAPGKVLLAGGYLVLDRDYTGLVFGLDARIHVHVQPVNTTSGVTLSEVTVRSPQFSQAVWEYGYRLSERDGGIDVTPLRVDADLPLSHNPFIETALSYALSYISAISSPRIAPSEIYILADNDYYSNPASTSTTTRFHDFGVPLSQANKTGLGSSAALVTAFTAAVLTYYLPTKLFDLTAEKDKRRLHNLAQAAHCAAQGKVGSGFDVASAVYGSCLYRRFSPRLLSSHGEPGSACFAKQLQGIVEETGGDGAWDTDIVKDAVTVPKGLRLVMCDVTQGSQTPGMVKQVLAWRKVEPKEAEGLWQELQKANEGLAAELIALAVSGESRDYSKLAACLDNIRQLIRLMSAKSGVPIEPPTQTALLDACGKVEGVIGGVVPGAGGFDAVALLIEDREEVVDSLRSVLENWNMDVGRTTSNVGGRVSMLGVREEMDGVRVEDPKQYGEWTG